MTMNAAKHPSTDVLEDYSLGHLRGLMFERVEEHLLVCETCQDELTAVDAKIRELKEACLELGERELDLRPVAHRPGFFQRFINIPIPVVAGACAAMLLTLAVPFVKYPAVNSVPAIVQLQTSRGSDDRSIARGDAQRPLHLRLSAPELPAGAQLRAEIVNWDGARIWSGAIVQEKAGLAIDVQSPLGPGLFWVRLVNGTAPVHEFGLELR